MTQCSVQSRLRNRRIAYMSIPLIMLSTDSIHFGYLNTLILIFFCLRRHKRQTVRYNSRLHNQSYIQMYIYVNNTWCCSYSNSFELSCYVKTDEYIHVAGTTEFQTAYFIHFRNFWELMLAVGTSDLESMFWKAYELCSYEYALRNPKFLFQAFALGRDGVEVD